MKSIIGANCFDAEAQHDETHQGKKSHTEERCYLQPTEI
jgi:hypothetical protein